MSLAGVLLLCLVLALGWYAPAAAAATPVQMLVRGGFDGAGKVGGWLPIDIDIRNDGDDIEGEIQVVVQDTATNRGTYTPAPTVFQRASHRATSLAEAPSDGGPFTQHEPANTGQASPG
jgi:hypothetical protein